MTLDDPCPMATAMLAIDEMFVAHMNRIDIGIICDDCIAVASHLLRVAEMNLRKRDQLRREDRASSGG